MEQELLNFLGSEREKTVLLGGRECALRLLTAREMLALRAKTAQKNMDDTEKALWANSELLAMSLRAEGEKLFADADEVISSLGLGEITALVEQYAMLDGRANPSPEDKREAVEALKKA